MELKNKVVLVTGATRGLGRGFCEYLADKNNTIYAGVRELHDKADFPANVTVVQLDVEDDKSIESALKVIQDREGRLDVLVNNAGLNKDTATNNHKELVSTLKNLDRAPMLRMMNVNSVSPAMVAKYALPLMTADECFIINISSNRASFHDSTNTAGNYGYRASKVALNMITQSMLYDLPDNVRTFAVHPGGVRTDMNPYGQLSPNEAAQNICNIVEHWKSDMNGKYLNDDGSLFPL